MNRAVRMTALGAAAISMLALGALLKSGPAQAEDDILDHEMMQLHGEFEISDGDVKVIARRHKPTTIRVCVDEAKHTVPLKVTSDRQETLVQPGNCSDVTGARITLSPAARLSSDWVLVGRWKHVKA
jgi:hypothetical protein